MRRIKFKKGEQRNFLKKVLEKTNCPSFRSISQFGFEIPYSTLKNYFSEKRLLPEDLFLDFCQLAKINPENLGIKSLSENWGQIKGGKIKRKKSTKEEFK